MGRVRSNAKGRGRDHLSVVGLVDVRLVGAHFTLGRRLCRRLPSPASHRAARRHRIASSGLFVTRLAISFASRPHKAVSWRIYRELLESTGDESPRSSWRRSVSSKCRSGPRTRGSAAAPTDSPLLSRMRRSRFSTAWARSSATKSGRSSGASCGDVRSTPRGARDSEA